MMTTAASHHGIRAAAAAVTLLAWASVAGAFPGDYRIIEGTLVWPQNLTPNHLGSSEHVAVVQGDLGTRYFAELTATTEVSAPVHAGHRVVVLAREGQQPSQLTAMRVESPPERPSPAQDGTVSRPPAASSRAPAASPPRPVTIEGTVLARSGSTLILRRADEHRVAVDIAALDGPAREVLQTGHTVSVFGTVLNGVVLVAQGVNVDYGAALPRSR